MASTPPATGYGRLHIRSFPDRVGLGVLCTTSDVRCVTRGLGVQITKCYTSKTRCSPGHLALCPRSALPVPLAAGLQCCCAQAENRWTLHPRVKRTHRAQTQHKLRGVVLTCAHRRLLNGDRTLEFVCPVNKQWQTVANVWELGSIAWVVVGCGSPSVQQPLSATEGLQERSSTSGVHKTPD